MNSREARLAEKFIQSNRIQYLKWHHHRFQLDLSRNIEDYCLAFYDEYCEFIGGVSCEEV